MTDSSRTVEQGQVLLASEVLSQMGRLVANDDGKLVLIFLGTVAKDGIPAVVPTLNKLGWFRHDMYQVVVKSEGEDKGTLFQEETPLEAIEAARRFAKKNGVGVIRDIELRTVRFGQIDEDGAPKHTAGEYIPCPVEA